MFIYQAPIGKLKIEIANEELVALDYASPSSIVIPPNTDFEKNISEQLDSYFKNSKFRFNLPLQLKGTIFQQRVWQQLQHTPSSTTLTYGELAKKLNSSPRAIGNACRANPIAIIIPCHRVIGKNSLGGYGGKTTGTKIDTKLWLLSHEKSV